jgi:hypothetical protein
MQLKIVMKHAQGGSMMQIEVKIYVTYLSNKPVPSL